MASSTDIATLTTPFGSDTLVLESISGEEAVSELFYYTVIANSTKNSLSGDQIVGETVSVKLPVPGCSGTARYINGICTRFTATVNTALTTQYIIEVRPWLWMLTMQSDCAVFQNMSVPDIVEKVCSDAGYSYTSNKLSSPPAEQEYIVQYNETACNFVSRLMEEAGIFYYFKHTSSSHSLVMADSPDAFDTCQGSDSLTYLPTNIGATPATFITNVSISQESVPGEFGVGDYYYETPDTALNSSASGEGTGVLYEYPGGFETSSDGDSIASRRLDAREATKSLLRATSPASGLVAGGKFSISKHDRSDVNSSWVVIRLSITASKEHYSARLVAVPSSTSYRPLRITPKPVIPGPLTAIVTGPEGEEISVDNYGCITIQFFWDRVGEKNELSSCAVRVAQPWAGKSIGTMFIPRVGTEVVVTFINGNPDRPIVTGQVYNADMTYPFPLPAAATKTALATMSSKEGSVGHQLYFEDKADEEEVFLSATKDVTVQIQNSRTTTISEADETLTLEKGNRSVEITEGTDTLKCGGKRELTIEADENHTTSGNFSGKTEGNYANEVGGNISAEVSGDSTMSVSGNATEEVSGNVTSEISGNFTQIVDGNYTISVEGNMTINVTGNTTINSEGNVTIVSEANLTTEAAIAATHSATAAMTIEGLEFSIVGEAGGTIEAGATFDVTSGMVMIE